MTNQSTCALCGAKFESNDYSNAQLQQPPSEAVADAMDAELLGSSSGTPCPSCWECVIHPAAWRLVEESTDAY